MGPIWIFPPPFHFCIAQRRSRRLRMTWRKGRENKEHFKEVREHMNYIARKVLFCSDPPASQKIRTCRENCLPPMHYLFVCGLGKEVQRTTFVPEVACGGVRPGWFVHFPGGCLLAPTMSGGKGRDLLIVIFFCFRPQPPQVHGKTFFVILSWRK